MTNSDDAQLHAVLKQLGLGSLISPDSRFGTSVIAAARNASRNIPTKGDIDALVAYALQPGMLTAMAAAVQKGTDDPEKKRMVADAIAPKNNIA